MQCAVYCRPVRTRSAAKGSLWEIWNAPLDGAPKYNTKDGAPKHSIFAFACDLWDWAQQLGWAGNWVISGLVQSKTSPVTVSDRDMTMNVTVTWEPPKVCQHCSSVMSPCFVALGEVRSRQSRPNIQTDSSATFCSSSSCNLSLNTCAQSSIGGPNTVLPPAPITPPSPGI